MVEQRVTEEMRQRADWRQRLVEAVLERKFDNEVLVTMLMAGFDQAQAEGILEAADICRDVAAGAPAAKRTAETLERSLRRLVEMNKDIEMALPAGFEPAIFTVKGCYPDR